MKYNLDSLGPFAFEEMIQALMQNVLGIGGTVFGTGKDGGREYIFEGEANLPFPNKEISLNGYWVVQAKFKMPYSQEKDNLKWIKEQFLGEMSKFKDPDKKLRKPDNYIILTNVKLTGQAEVGEIDKLNKFKKEFEEFIPNIHFILYDDICSLLENNRDVATSYLSYIMPGDVLSELFNFYKKDQEKLSKVILNYLQSEFKDDMNSKLEQSGRRTDDNIKIENVFIDLFATESNIVDAELYNSQINKSTTQIIDKDGYISIIPYEEKRFVERIVELSNDSQRQCNKGDIKTRNKQNKFVLIGSAGQGKSTLTQFLSQMFRAYFINATAAITPKFINEFLINIEERKIKINVPETYRLPIRIILTNYSEWITKRKKDKLPVNVMSYIKSELESNGDNIEIDDLRNIFSKISNIIIFDGLDEVPASSNRDVIVSEIDKFIEIDLHNQNSDSIIIITTRPQGFKDEFNNDKFTHLKIVELSKSDCKEYLTILVGLSESKQAKRDKNLTTLFRALEKESSSRLMKTPLDATIMATLVKRGGNPPEVKYNLYKDYYTTIFDREKEKGVFELDKYKSAINSLHEYLGFRLQSSSEQKKDSAKITRGNFILEIKKYFLAKEFSDEEATKNTTVISEVLTDRLVMIAELTTDLDNQDNNIIGYPVAPIQEYFASLYLVHSEDSVVIQRIRQISSKSYWRNVLLFMIGYFQNEGREYLNDHIYTECKQNNEMESETSKVGAWLAVDILIENIFSEIPKYENLFANELQTILSLSPSNKHDYLLRMPEKIIIKHLKLHLENELKTKLIFSQKLTTWKVLIQIPVLLNDIIEKFWPSGDEELELLCFIINQDKINYNLFIDKVISRLIELLDFNIQLIENNVLFKILINSKKIQENDKKKIIELLYLYNSGNQNSNIELILGIGKKEDDVENDYYISTLSNKTQNKKVIKISDNYSREIVSLEQSSEINNMLKSIFIKYQIEYLEKLIDFNLNPNKVNLNVFLLALLKADNINFSQIKKSNENWVIQCVLDRINEIKDIKDVIKYINTPGFGDIKEWSIVENAVFEDIYSNLFLKDVFLRKSKPVNSSNGLIESFNSFEPLITSGEIRQYTNLQNEFVIKFVTTNLTFGHRKSPIEIEDEIKIDYKIIENILILLLDKEYALDFSNSGVNIHFLLLNGLFRHIKDKDMMKFSMEDIDNLFSRLSITTKSDSNLFQILNNINYDLIIKSFNYSLFSEKESSFIRFIFLTFISKPNSEYLKKIDLIQLKKITYLDKQNKISSIFLMLIVSIQECHIDQNLITELKNQYAENNFIAEYLIDIISFEKFDLNVCAGLINDFYYTIKELEPNNYKLQSRFETLLKEKIESLSSKFDNDEIKIALKLYLN